MRLRVLTDSSMKKMRRCPREFYYSECGYMTKRKARVLDFGNVIHDALDHGFSNGWDFSDEAIGKILAGSSLDKWDAARARAMLKAYAIRWEGTLDEFSLIASEVEFRAPIVNPGTGSESRSFVMAGKVDKVLEHRFTGHLYGGEHKTSSEDLSVASIYWDKLVLNTQISCYYVGISEKFKRAPYAFLYDVLGKIRTEPKLATPESQRKYTKKDGRLYADQRETDESVEEFEARLLESYARNVNGLFVRNEVVRLERDHLAAARNTWHTTQHILHCIREKYWPQNPDACERYKRMCEFWPVCSGQAQITDTSLYVKGRPHQELSEEICRG